MKLDNETMKNAIKRINELQQEIVEKAKNIAGSEEFIKQKISLYEEDERIRQMAKNIQIQEKTLTENFFNKQIVEGK